MIRSVHFNYVVFPLTETVQMFYDGATRTFVFVDLNQYSTFGLCLVSLSSTQWRLP